MKKVDIIMAVYDEPVSVLKRTISDIFSQTLKSIRLIVCIDNPKNNEALQYLNNISGTYDIKVIENRYNQGLGFSLNNCLEHCSAEYIARWDADDTCDKDRLKKQSEYLDANEKCDVIFTGYSIVNSDGKLVTPNLKDNATMQDDFFTSNPFKHGTLMMRRHIYVAHGYKISNAPEDYEMYFRMVKNNVRFSLLNEPLYNHHKFEKQKYRLNIDSYKRHSKMTKIYSNILIRNFFILRKWKGYYQTLVKMLYSRVIFSNYQLYKLIKNIKSR